MNETTPSLAISNIWNKAGATISGIGIGIATITPFVVGQRMPATTSEWVLEIAGIAMALAKAFGK